MRSLKVIYEDADFIVVDKQAGLLVHAAPHTGAHEETLVQELLGRYPEIKTVGDSPSERPGIVHRLDKDTSGVMLVARNKEAFEYLKKLFQSHFILKKYLVLAFGNFPEKAGIIDKPIGLVSGTTKHTTRIFGAKLVKPARTAYRVLREFKHGEQKFSLLEVSPETGRTHQIRVHLASIGHHVLGDPLYGGKNLDKTSAALGLKRQFLHAASIEFTSPRGDRIKAEAGLPEDLERVLDLLSPAHSDRQRRN